MHVCQQSELWNALWANQTVRDMANACQAAGSALERHTQGEMLTVPSV